MRALGKSDLPAAVRLDGQVFRLSRTVKHDFFAATGFYEGPQGRRVVLKMGRVADFAGFPMLWLGTLLCRRELGFYRKLSDIAQVPKVLGTLGPTGFLLEFVPGTPLTARPGCPDSFFAELQDVFTRVHGHGIAYVDADKSQNILLGADGHPHLIDFQISFDADSFRVPILSRLLLGQFQKSDVYHVLKHKARLRPDQLTPAENESLRRRSLPIRIHRVLFKPYFDLRRRTFQRLRATGRLLPEGSK
jgi:hypothetical protein